MNITNLVHAYARTISALLLSTLFVTVLFTSAAQAAPAAKLIEFWDDSMPTSRMQMKYDPLAAFLGKYVITDHSSGVNRIAFDRVTAQDQASIGKFLQYMQQMDPRQLNLKEQKAYWLNLFNTTVIKSILESEPTNSMREVGGRFWSRDRLVISWQEVSLDDIEHGVLRPIFKDPRLHFAFVAGTVGSGEVLAQPFTADNIEQLLDETTRRFLNHQRGVARQGDELVLSRIFRWYKDDFGGDFSGVKRFILPYLEGDLKQFVAGASRASYDYDWSLIKP